MRRLHLSLLSFVSVMAFGGTAHADTSSWLAIGPGYAIERNSFDKTGHSVPTLSMSLGVGSSPKAKFVVGGLVRTVTYFSLGTDLGLAARFATGGFAVIELDLLRLTLMRQGSTDAMWFNASPAGGR